MASDRTFEDNADLQGLAGDAIVDLWFIDMWSLDPTLPASQRFFRFVNYVVADGQNVAYASVQYLPIPYKAEGFEIKTDGVPPSPKLTVANIGLEWTALVNAWDDLVGAQITRRRVLARHLDGGTDPDGAAHWPDEVWTIQQKTAESKLTVEFTLSTAFDLDGVTLPRRRALRYTCPWVYRSVDCGYQGPPVANRDDEPIQSTDPALQDLSDARAQIPITSAAMRQAQEGLAQAQTNVSAAQNELSAAQAAINNYQGSFVKRDQRYNRGTDYVFENSEEGGGAKWDNNNVNLGEEYRRENQMYQNTYKKEVRRPGQRYSSYINVTETHWAISRWSRDNTPPGSYVTRRDNAQAALTTAQAAETQAETDYNTSVVNYDDATQDYRDALQAWQTAGSNTAGDECGKRLASCRLRWYDPIAEEVGDMSYGGFPGLSGL